MRISDWSSDVCSSDLGPDRAAVYDQMDRAAVASTASAAVVAHPATAADVLAERYGIDEIDADQRRRRAIGGHDLDRAAAALAAIGPIAAPPRGGETGPGKNGRGAGRGRSM